MFVDPMGLHTLITVQIGSTIETHYLDHSWKKSKPLAKLKNVIITSVGWPPLLRATSLRDVLLGTDKSALLALTIEDAGVVGRRPSSTTTTSNASAQPIKETVNPLGTLPGSNTTNGTPPQLAPIAGIAQIAIPTSTTTTTTTTSDERLILVLCGTNLHLFRGSMPIVSLFAAYDPSTLPSKDAKIFDLPIEQGAAQLQMLYPARHPDSSAMSGTAPFRLPCPTEFAILSTSGIYYGRLDLDATIKDELDHLKAHKLLPSSVLLGTLSTAPPAPTDRPLSLALTQQHLALLYPSRLQFINRVSKRVVQEIPLERFAAPLRGAAALPLGLGCDVVAGRVDVLAGDEALEIDSSNEDRDMWKVYLDRGEFAQALYFCRTAVQRNAVYLAEAEALLAENRPVEAAERYGKVTASVPPFEDLALKLMETGNPAALTAFLFARLSTLGPDDLAQATMVATWLLELLLDAANRAALGKREGQEGEAAAAEADARVQQFLTDKVDNLDPGTVVSLLEGYGRTNDLLAFARVRGDFEMVLEILMQQGQAERALEVLRKPSVSPELAYRYAPALVAIAPAQTVQSWIEASPPLDPRRLLPALLHLTEKSAPPAARAEAMRYVGYCIDRIGCVDSAMHSFAVALLVATPSSTALLPTRDHHHRHHLTTTTAKEGEGEEEDALLEYLATARDALGRPLYDPVHALRLAREWNRPRAMVALLSEVGLWEDAVQMALDVGGRDAAIAVARRPSGDTALTRRLWLTIAKHVVGSSELKSDEDRRAQVREVSDLLDQSGGALHIEDVLPLFPDFVEIGAFRDAICFSLEQYNAEMEDLRSEMNMATRTAAALRESLERVEGRAAAIDLEEPCASCGRPLHQQPPASAGPSGGALPRLFLFPSGNAFHGSCLCAEAGALAPPPQRKRIARLAARLAGVSEHGATVPADGTDPAISTSDLKRQLEDEVAVEDPFCGEIVVRHLTQPIILPEEATEAASWAV